jgi:hypothetical protein
MSTNGVLIRLSHSQTRIVFLLNILITLIPLEDVPGVLLVSYAFIPLKLYFAVLVFDELRRCHHAWLDLEPATLRLACLVL